MSGGAYPPLLHNNPTSFAILSICYCSYGFSKMTECIVSETPCLYVLAGLSQKEYDSQIMALHAIPLSRLLSSPSHLGMAGDQRLLLLWLYF